MVGTTVLLVLGKWRQEDPWGLLASRASLPRKLQVPVRDSVSKPKWTVLEE